MCEVAYLHSRLSCALFGVEVLMFCCNVPPLYAFNSLFYPGGEKKLKCFITRLILNSHLFPGDRGGGGGLEGSRFLVLTDA